MSLVEQTGCRTGIALAFAAGLFPCAAVAGPPPGMFADFSGRTSEHRLSAADLEHGLANANVWTRDGKWVVYDVRVEDGSKFNAIRIEMANIETGGRRTLYHAHDGAGCGVVSFSPGADLAAFILGPENPAPDWDYALSRRRGVLVDINNPGEARALDAMNYAPPFAPGALRGGSHVHMFSPDGRWVSFTYDDEILTRLDEAAASGRAVPGHDAAQRNIAVAVPDRPVRVARTHARNHDGNYFSVVVSRTVNAPRPGSDEISRACEEGWIGVHGYLKADGTRQRRALAFQGTVTAKNGSRHAEVFVVDLPDDPTVCGEGPLEGTGTRRPAPPRGAVQRRLTFTDARKHPGLAAEPRHWLRSSPDGEAVGFVMKDDEGVAQFWTIPPRGGEPRQVTRLAGCSGIASAFTWSPDGRLVTAIIDGSVCVIDIASGRAARLTPRREGGDAPVPLVSVFSPDGRRIAYMRGYKISNRHQRHVFVVNLPEGRGGS